MLFWYSEKQAEYYKQHGGYQKNYAFIEGDRVLYTDSREETIEGDYKDLWEDAVFLGAGSWANTDGLWTPRPPKPPEPKPIAEVIISDTYKRTPIATPTIEDLMTFGRTGSRIPYTPKEKKNKLFTKKR